jgi:predicted transport protein
MSYQAYLDNIKKKTGKTPDDFRSLAEKRGLLRADVKAGEVLAWLKADFGLGHGHAMAIYGTLRSMDRPQPTVDERLGKHFSGLRAGWQQVYRQLMTKVEKFGPDVTVKPTDSYISILRSEKKFAIVQISADRLDVGIKAKNLEASRRLELSGQWNTMVTHRVRVESAGQIDAELIGWLRTAYDRSASSTKPSRATAA